MLDDAGEEFVRQRGEDARAVACVRFATAGAAVIHVAEHFLGVDQNLVAPLAFDVGDETDAAGIVFISRVVEPGRAWCRSRHERAFHGPANTPAVPIRFIHYRQP